MFWRLSMAKLSPYRDTEDFDFADTPVNESLVSPLHTSNFVDQRDAVHVGRTCFR